MKTIIAEEVKTTLSASTLFRSNNVASKMLTIYGMDVGKEFIVNLLQSPLRKYLSSNKSLEIDPQKLVRK